MNKIFYVFCMFLMCNCSDIENSFELEDASFYVEDAGTDIVEESETTQCNTYCKSNEDCDQWGGFCTLIFDGYNLRTLCTEDCNESKSCSQEGFYCIPLTKGGFNFDWQCLPIDGPICEGDS